MVPHSLWVSTVHVHIDSKIWIGAGHWLLKCIYGTCEVLVSLTGEIVNYAHI